jgi:hypothetical protein
MTKPLSPLTIQARNIANCIEILEKEGHQAQAISITPDYSLISIAFTPHTKQLHGVYRGIVRGKGGMFMVYQIKLHDVHVQWLVPYFDAAQQKRLH